MNGIVKVGDKEVPVISNAATAFVFKNCFKEDLLSFLAKENPDEGAATEMLIKAFYIMAKQAECPEMPKLLKSGLSYENFIEFVSQYEIFDSGNIATQVFNIWNGNATTTESAEPSKKKAAKTAK